MSTAHPAATDGEDSAPPIRTVAGTGVAGAKGDGGPAISAQVDYPNGIAMDRRGTLYVADYRGHQVRRITTDGRISTIAGTGSANFGGDGGQAASAQLRRP
ncbi:NHL domain-containing protein [Streptomyces corynorhini]|uniref:NHL domain-containing protein n=1 Tax=Streptomyces corynorhini TaxID=2282652 RepID=UPI0026D62074|nr:hypothetical protein [Streptomyces corynorhini]